MKEIPTGNQPPLVPSEIIIYGGAFNPPTVAHALAIASLTQSFPDKPIWVMPSGERNDKPELIGEQHRLAMLGIMAVEQGWRDKVVISDFELRLPRPSNTYDTVQALRQAGVEKVGFVVGVDSINTALDWEYGEALLRELHWILIERPGYELSVVPTSFEYVALPNLDVSSTEVRRRLGDGLTIGGLVVPAVEEYIAVNELYKEQI